MTRHLSVLTCLLLSLAPYAQAQDAKTGTLWNRREASDSRIPYTVTTPGSAAILPGLSLWNKTPGAPKKSSITAKAPRQDRQDSPAREPRTEEEWRARVEESRAAKAPGLAAMRADNLRKAEELNRLAAAQIVEIPQSQAISAPAAAEQAAAPKKTIYLKPETKMPQKTFPGAR